MDVRQVVAWLRREREGQLADLQTMLRIPSISGDPDHAVDMEDCAQAMAGLLQRIGLEEVTVHPLPGHPLVTGSWCHAPGKPTILIYGHYDVQPVDPLAEWERPPFDPWIHGERIIARGSSDNKGQILMHLRALEAWMQVHGSLPVNVILLIDGEEEISSPSLPAFLREHRATLAADFVLVSDSAMWDLNQPAITMGLRGLSRLEIELTGPNRDLHSGNFGGAVANPLEMLARMLAGLKDMQGRIQVPGFYDRVREITRLEREQLSRVPFDESAYFRDLGLTEGWGEVGQSTLERLWFRPTLEINGMWGGFTGPGTKTVLPAKAWAKLSFRLVPDQDPEEILVVVAAHLRAVTPPGVTLAIRHFPGSGKPVVTPQDFPALTAVRRALQQVFGQEPVLIRDGASIPIVADFQEILGLSTLLVGFSLPDARTHSPNENLHLPTFYAGTEAIAAMLGDWGLATNFERF